MSSNELLTLTEAAERVGISVAAMRRFVERWRLIPSEVVDGQTMVRVGDLPPALVRVEGTLHVDLDGQVEGGDKVKVGPEVTDDPAIRALARQWAEQAPPLSAEQKATLARVLG